MSVRTILTITLFILVHITAGCTDNTTSVPNPTTPAATNIATSTPTTQPAPAPTEWASENPIYPDYKLHILSPDETLFDKEIICYVNEPAYKLLFRTPKQDFF